MFTYEVKPREPLSARLTGLSECARGLVVDYTSQISICRIDDQHHGRRRRLRPRQGTRSRSNIGLCWPRENGALEGTWLCSLVEVCQRMIKRALEDGGSIGIEKCEACSSTLRIQFASRPLMMPISSAISTPHYPPVSEVQRLVWPGTKLC